MTALTKPQGLLLSNDELLAIGGGGATEAFGAAKIGCSVEGIFALGDGATG